MTGSHKAKWIGLAIIKFIEYYRPEMKKLSKSKRFESPKSIFELANNASTILSVGNQTGEGWFLTAEMIELISQSRKHTMMQPLHAFQTM